MKYTEELKQKKQAVYIALLNYLSPDKAANAANIWRDEFSRRPAFELQSFITRITDEFNVIISRKELQQIMIKTILNKDNHLHADNTSEHVSLPDSKMTAQPEHTIFTFLVAQWMNEINSINSDFEFNVKQYIYDNLEKLQLSFDEILNIKRWFYTKDQSSYIDYLTLEQLKKIFHYCYIGSCEYIGPVKTDKIISEIVNSIEETPEALHFSPRNFF